MSRIFWLVLIRGFKPRAREGRDIEGAGIKTKERSFKPRAREGRDICGSVRIGTSARFKPRAREGRDQKVMRHAKFATTVSSHAPAKGATLPRRSTLPRFLCFKPRAREGRDSPPKRFIG